MINPGWYIKQAEPVWESERYVLINQMENIFENECPFRQALLDMNRAPPSRKLKEAKELKNDIEAFNKWRFERDIRLA